jgi:hypothetical protein
MTTACGSAWTTAESLQSPLAWFPRLLTATAEQRAQFELSPRGIHWEALDEDVSIDGLLAGHGDLTHARLVTSA